MCVFFFFSVSNRVCMYVYFSVSHKETKVQKCAHPTKLKGIDNFLMAILPIKMNPAINIFWGQTRTQHFLFSIKKNIRSI